MKHNKLLLCITLLCTQQIFSTQNCLICLDPIKEDQARYSQLACDHTKHYDESCLQQWLVSKSDYSCPECRKPGGILRINRTKKKKDATLPAFYRTTFLHGRRFKEINFGSIMKVHWNPFYDDSHVLVKTPMSSFLFPALLLRRWKDILSIDHTFKKPFEGKAATITSYLYEATPVPERVSNEIDTFVDEGTLVKKLTKHIKQAFEKSCYRTGMTLKQIFMSVKENMENPSEIFGTNNEKEQFQQFQAYRKLLKIYK